MVELKIKCVSNIYKEKELTPEYKTDGSAGMDLKAAIEKCLILKPGIRYMIPTGIAISLPKGTAGLIYPRSGLASKHGIGLINSVGIIDEDYRGEIFCPLINFSNNEYILNPLDRMVQLIITPIIKTKITLVKDLDSTIRGNYGFGSTGK